MGNIPVLNDTQMKTLRGVLTKNEKFDLTNPKSGRVKKRAMYENANENETEAEAYTGPFTVTYDPQKKSASVKGGWAVANGTWLTVEDAENIKLTDQSFVCVSASLKEKNWTTKIEVAEPNATKYPVAYAELKKVYLEGDAEAPEGVEIKTEGTGENAKRYYETFKIIQYHVAVAMFMVVKSCPGVPQ